MNMMGDEEKNKQGSAADSIKAAAGQAAHQVKKKGIEAGVAATGVGAPVAKPTAAVLDKTLSAKNAKRGVKAGIGGIIILMIGFGSLIVSQQTFSNIKESTTDWSDKFLRDSYHLRTARVLNLRYFAGSECDLDATAECKLKAGATKIEIDNMKRVGLLKDGDYSKGGDRYTVQRLRYMDKAGKEQTIDSGAEFIAKYPKTADLIKKFHASVIDPKALAFRSPQGVHVLYKFGVLRNNSIGTETKLEDIVEDFRGRMASGAAKLTPVAGEGGGDVSGIQSTLSEGVSATKSQDPDEYGAGLEQATSSLDGQIIACTKESLMEQISVMGKIVKAPALIKYNASVQSVIDQDRDGKLKAWQQSSMLANMLNKGGLYDVSKGKIYSDSGAYTLLNQGNMRDDALKGMSKYANGVMLPGLSYGDGTCPGVAPLGSFVVDEANSGGVYGNSSGVNAMEWLTPQILMFASGNIVPDPEKDIEGGYNAGSAFASGASSLASYIGRGAGNRPVSQDEFKTIDEQADESSYIVSSPSDDSPGVGSQLSALGSQITSGNIRQASSTMAGLYQSSVASIANTLSPTASAQPKYVDKYRGELCTDYDVKEQLKMWPSWSCDPISAQLPEHLNSDDYDPSVILSGMIGGGYIYGSNSIITEEVFYGNLPELLAACREQGINDPVQCVPKEEVQFVPFAGGPLVYNNNFCDDLSLKSPIDITTYPEPVCNRPGAHSYDFVDNGTRLERYEFGIKFLIWYATCNIWNHPILTQTDYLFPKYLPSDGTPIFETTQCTDTHDNRLEAMHRLFQLYVKDRNIADSMEDVGSNSLGDDTCSDPIYPNPNKFCALDEGTRVVAGSAAAAAFAAASGAGGASGGGGTATGGTSGGTTPEASGTAQELAKQILASGNVTGDSRYMGQIRAYANGDFSCNISIDILRLVATAAQSHTLYITSLNRACTGVLTASGTSSWHYRDGGGRAIDLGIIDGTKSTGGSSKDIAFLNQIVGTLPSGSQIGQEQCRPAGSVKLPSGIYEINDTCNHVHISIPS